MVKVGEISVEILANTSKLRANLAQASSLIRDFALLSEGLTGGISMAFSQITDVAIKGLQIGLGALIGSFTLAATTGAAFEDEMMRAFTIMKEGGNATASSLSEMTSKALELGRESLFSAIDAAEGMQILARAGFNTKEVINSIGPVMNLAIADNLELAESSEIVISALRGFNLETRDARRVTDVMALGASKASTDVSDLGEAFKYVAPVAAGFGISLEETVAAIGLLSDSGIRGSMAGTTLRRAFSELMAPTAKAEKILKSLGVTGIDSSGKLRPFASILQDLKSAGMTASQAMEVFGQRGGPGMVALLSRGAGALRDLTNDLENSKGAAEDMAQAFRTTVKGRVRDLIASVVDLGLAFSEKFKKPLAEAIFFVRNFVVDLVNVGNRLGIFNTIVKGMQEVLKPISGLVKELASDFKKWLASLTAKDVLQFFSSIKKGIEGFIESFKKGEVGAIVKDTLNVFIGLGKIVIGTIKGIADAWIALPQGFRDAARPLVIISAIILQLFGGVLNIVFLVITLNALWSTFGFNVSLVAIAIGSIRTFFVSILVIVGVISAAIVGWTVGSFIGELSIVKGIFTSIFIIINAIGPSLKYLGMLMLTVAEPYILLNKKFRTELATTMEEIKVASGAIRGLDWFGVEEKANDLVKIKDGVISIGVAAKEVSGAVVGMLGDKKTKLGVEKSSIDISEKEANWGAATTGEKEANWGAATTGRKKVNPEVIKAQTEIEALQKMIGQAGNIEGVLGTSMRTSLITGLQERLNALEKIVMGQTANLTSLNRQNIKPSTDGKNKPRINAGLE